MHQSGKKAIFWGFSSALEGDSGKRKWELSVYTVMKKGMYPHCESDKPAKAPAKKNTAYYMLCSAQSRFLKG